MAVPLDKFVRQLEESGIVAGETLKDFLPPRASPRSAEELALELVRNKKLTKFQAEEVSRGKGKSLTLGNYLLMEKIGAGGMGQVFKARHRVMNRIVAVKVLPASLTRDEAAIARFHREVQAAARLNHPNIVTAYDADQANGVHFLVMELVEGSDLSALVKKNGPFSVEKGVSHILQAAKGLEAAHAEGIVHRDIKPANLLLDKKGTLKILDMGLARLNGNSDDATQADLTSTGTVMGTVDYMAPEQALNTKTADARADIYALGCSLFYLLTGKATYDGDTLMAKLLAHRDEPIPDLRVVCPQVPEPLGRLFKKMVAKKVEDRYQTMTEVIADLESCGVASSNSLSVQPAVAGQTILGQEISVSSRTANEPNPATSKFNPPSNWSFVDIAANEDQLDFHTERVSKPTKQPSRKRKSSFLRDQKKLVLIGSGTLGVVILLAVAFFTNRPGDGKSAVTAKLPPSEQKGEAATTGWHGWPADAPKPAISPFNALEASQHQKAWARYLNVPVEYTNSIGIKFRLIPPGEFLMGSSDEQIEAAAKVIEESMAKADPGIVDAVRALADSIRVTEQPQHRVVITRPLMMGITEVTIGQFKKFAAATGYQTEAEKVELAANAAGEQPPRNIWNGTYLTGLRSGATDDFPAMRLTWNDSVAFCIWLSDQDKLAAPYDGTVGKWMEPTGKSYHLPTEAQYEYACRAGTTTQYSFGDDPKRLADFLWNQQKEVGRRPPNAFGLYDLQGSAWEWCQDWFDEKWYEKSPTINPIGPFSGTHRVLRGGSWYPDETFCRSAHRLKLEPTEHYFHYGLRVVLTVDAVRKMMKVTGPAMPNDRD